MKASTWLFALKSKPMLRIAEAPGAITRGLASNIAMVLASHYRAPVIATKDDDAVHVGYPVANPRHRIVEAATRRRLVDVFAKSTAAKRINQALANRLGMSTGIVRNPSRTKSARAKRAGFRSGINRKTRRALTRYVHGKAAPHKAIHYARGTRSRGIARLDRSAARPNKRRAKGTSKRKRKARPNPRGLANGGAAARTFKRWHEFDATKVLRLKGPARQIPSTLVRLGELVEVVYKSNKYEGRQRLYSHKTETPRPILATDPSGKSVHIVGGKMRPTADGLVG